MGAVSFFFAGMAADGGVALLYNLPAEFFSQDFRIMVVGTVVAVLVLTVLSLRRVVLRNLIPSSKNREIN